MKVLITDKINESAGKILEGVAEVVFMPTQTEDELCNIIGEYDALMVRSQTKVTKKIIDAATNMKIIGRAGVGVDNIDIEAATQKGILVVIEELGSAMQDIMSQIFHGLSKGIHDVDICLTIHEPKPSIKNLAENRIYFDDGKLVIDGETIELPIQLDESQIYEFESGYISALCDAYAEALSRDEVTVDDIPNLPRKYQINFYDQRKAYLSAESIQRSISEVYEDGENQFDILKEDAFGGIKTTYYDEYDNGYRRLLEVLKKISDIQLTKSKLMLIKNLIGNLERLGIVHILVNDETIKSWVDPYEE